VGLLLAGPVLTGAQEATLRETLSGLDPSSYLYVERGYQVPGSERVVLLILFGLGGVLMLGGTLTATFLALSDARPDLATLSAVGASPRTRRGVAAAYAVAVGLVGAVLGAAVGFIPGIAITYPLTRSFTGEGGPSHYLVIPWLLIGALVVALPLLTAGVVGLLARSRLPVVARLD
jgi:putative ABC transport system permease protein